MEIGFTIGVSDLQIHSQHQCTMNSAKAVHFLLSFGLKGDFFQAACSDALVATVDYNALSEHLKAHLMHAKCDDLEAIIASVKPVIADFSPKISGGYVTVGIRCHEPFLVMQGLL